jgi:phage repressor protein C with HTH and peptisase S24 domain
MEQSHRYDLLLMATWPTLLPAIRHDVSVLPWQTVRVVGPSMVPTLYDGDVVIVRHGARIRTGDVVLARFRSLPDRYVVKRAESPDGDGWLLRSDNELAGGDSRSHGVADVLARVVLRLPGRGLRLPRRMR